MGLFFSAFFTTLGQEAGKDAYQRIRRLTSRLVGARRNSNGCVELWDDVSRTHIILTADLPEEALVELVKLGVANLEGGYWTWVSETKQWRRL